MIPFEELEKALTRWKSRSQNAAVDAAREFEASGAVPMDDGGVLPPPPDRTGEIDIGDSEAVVEALDDN